MARAKKNTNPAPKKPAKKGGFSLLNAIGVKTEAKPTDSDRARAEIHATCEDGYWFLRQMIDKAIMDFYKTGSFDKLEQFVDRPALDAMREKLGELRERQILWMQPDRSKRKPHLKIVESGLVLNRQGLPTRFVVEERFVDRSVHQFFEGGQPTQALECPGRERTIRATVDVRDGEHYTLRSVTEIRAVA